MLVGPVVHRAWEITRHYKGLWVLGAFAGAAPTFAYQWQMSRDPSSSSLGFANLLTTANTILVLILLSLGVLTVILHLICSAALVDAVNRLARTGVYRLGASFSAGFDYFWRFLGLLLMNFLASIVLILLIGLPAALMFLAGTSIGFFSLIVFVPIGVVGFLSLFCIYELARRAVVMRGISIGDGVEEAWYLFRHNLATNAQLTLIVFGLTLAMVLIFIVIIGLAVAPFVTLALVPHFGFILALILGIPVLFLVLVLFNGFSGAFLSAIYTLFYFELLQMGDSVTFSLPQESGNS